MWTDGTAEYVPDKLYQRLFQPATLPAPDWALAREDWARVDAISWLPWKGSLLDFGSGDGTLAAMVCSRNPLVYRVELVEQDAAQTAKALLRWKDWPLHETHNWTTLEYDGALCCEVLEHLTPDAGHQVLCDIKRVLKPGAMLCVTVPNVAGPRATYPGHIREFDISQFARTVADAGFTIEDGDAIGGKIIPVWFMAVARA
jgi:2-polyprenyl-3-methyl-5-hydroxy-6-metoxy-1,4-benzoquinol methylase